MQPLNSQKDPGDQKNMLLAILLSVCVLLGWQFFYANPKVQKERERLRVRAEILKSLAHPTRLYIVEELGKGVRMEDRLKINTIHFKAHRRLELVERMLSGIVPDLR